MSSKNSEWRDDSPTRLGGMGQQRSVYSNDSTATGTPPRPDEAAANKRPPRKGGIKWWAVAISAVLAVVCLGGISGMSSMTFMPRWIPWSIALGTALGTGMWGKLLWRRITGSDKDWLNYTLHTVMATLLICCGLYLGNQLGASDRGDTTVATVERVYSETRYRSKRVGRNRYVRGDAYHVYFASLRFDNATVRDIPVNYNRYRRLRAGMTLKVGVRRGGLGYGVIDGITGY